MPLPYIFTMIATKYLVLTYLDHVHAYLQKQTVWGNEPSEEFMRAVEMEYGGGIREVGADDFRRLIFGYLGHLQWTNKPFAWNFDSQLVTAVEKLMAKSVKECEFMKDLSAI